MLALGTTTPSRRQRSRWGAFLLANGGSVLNKDRTQAAVRTVDVEREAPPSRRMNWWQMVIFLFLAIFTITSIGLLLTASMFNTIPILILFFIFQRYFIEGAVSSGVKG
jgi:hypothetical protein